MCSHQGGRKGGGGWKMWGAQCLGKLKGAASQIGLYSFFILYTAGGALVFRALEHPHEVEEQAVAARGLIEGRNRLLEVLANASTPSLVMRKARASEELGRYEARLVEAVGVGVSVTTPSTPNYSWQFAESVFFASTIVTTIGYGNQAPVTFWGRLFCILFGFIGIPVTLSVISELGTFFANLVSRVYFKLRDLVNCGLADKWLAACGSLGDKGSKGAAVVGAVGALLIYMGVGGAFFTLWEDNWSFFEGFYFCFITMTTVGLGDLVPARTDVMLICTVYILVGLAITSTIIELLRRQYAESWRQMKELSGRLGELSGPLSDVLRKLGDHAGDLSVDVRLPKDLLDLRHALQLSQRLDDLTRGDPGLKNDLNDLKLLDLLKQQLRGSGRGSSVGKEGEGPFLLPSSSSSSSSISSSSSSSSSSTVPSAAKGRTVLQVIIYESSV
ncbi:potassium channel subfamily K member 1-like [Portunus trituberculatus]|uniref:potassium channel subfamily K member 1-like n=1 Tax=Portunus trituberculatus TaxID=210409 RepID=UPI001E1CF2A1|nr:potassium channel subfamily K member 1-like [Portunus trituberculatus]XP_045108642.1 potassium channel subfamily K member 1-like [Portunus trituberculatus]